MYAIGPKRTTYADLTMSVDGCKAGLSEAGIRFRK